MTQSVVIQGKKDTMCVETESCYIHFFSYSSRSMWESGEPKLIIISNKVVVKQLVS